MFFRGFSRFDYSRFHSFKETRLPGFFILSFQGCLVSGFLSFKGKGCKDLSSKEFEVSESEYSKSGIFMSHHLEIFDLWTPVNLKPQTRSFETLKYQKFYKP
jgi:hypothetical protein